MVVATHGRSFWILDDVSPLRELTSELFGATHYLFKPRSTYRLRMAGRRLAEDSQPHMVNYARADASLVSFEPAARPADGIADRLLDAGANPPAGVQIFYHLRDQPSGDVRLDILEPDGTPIRSFEATDLRARAGLNRVVWDMRHPGVPSVKKVGNLDPWERPHGPMVLPGTYRARLTVNDRQLEQSFEILADPRLGDRATELTAQLEMLREIYARLSACNELVNRISQLEDQIASLRRWNPDLPGTIEALLQQSGAIKELLIDVNMRRAQLYASGLHEKLNALIEFVDSGDYAPAQQAREVFAELAAQLDRLTNQFDATARAHLPELSRLIEQSVSGEVMIPA